MTTFTNLSNDVATLQAMLIASYTDEKYGCLTKAGIQNVYVYAPETSVIFLDIDGMHDLNKKYSYAGVDARIKASIAVRESDTVAGRWMSGDEIVFIVPTDDAEGLIARLQNSFAAQGLTAMYASAPIASNISLDEAVTIAASNVQAQKAVRGSNKGLVRRFVNFVRGMFKA